MRKLIWIVMSLVLALSLAGCSAGGDVDEGAVQKQADKEKEINQKAEENLPPGDGPAG